MTVTTRGGVTGRSVQAHYGRVAAWVGYVTVCLAAALGTAQAHHSFAMFDQARELQLTGTVHDFEWTNPHAFIDLDVQNPQGVQDLWKVELNSPNNLKRQGWKSDALKAGDKVVVVINPLRDGTRGGLFVAVTLADGRVLGDPTRRGGGPINVPSTQP